MPVLTSLRPSAAVHGGRVTLLGTDLPIPSDGPPDVTIGGVKSRVVFASRRAIEVLVPADAAGGRLPVQVADVPEGALALARSEQRLIEGYYENHRKPREEKKKAAREAARTGHPTAAATAPTERKES